MADHKSKATFGFGGFEHCLMPLLQLGQALLQTSDARLELNFINEALGKNVDEPTNASSQTGYLTVETKDLIRQGGAVMRLGQATVIFV